MITIITSRTSGTMALQVATTTGRWKYQVGGAGGTRNNGYSAITIPNVTAGTNSEITIISCDAGGNPSGDITYFRCSNNRLTSFDISGTDLTSLSELNLDNNELTSFDGTDLTSLTDLYLARNQFTSFDGTGLTSLINLHFYDNQLTSLDVSPMINLSGLYLAGPYGLQNNPMTPTSNDSILSQLVSNNNTSAEYYSFYTTGGRTTNSTSDYNTLIERNWTLLGLEPVVEAPTPPPASTRIGKLGIRRSN